MRIHSLSKNISQKIYLGGSKSISNRLLVLNALFDYKINLENLSNAEDTQLLKQALQSHEIIIDIKHAGTAMRFLTSYFAYRQEEKILTGSPRMKERPIGVLVEGLRSMGITIEYIENIGFPPLKIIPSKFETNKLSIKADTSSQFITSLMLIGSKLPNGLELELLGKITSLPYLEMTLMILRNLGIDAIRNKNIITIQNKQDFSEKNFIIESDWSSASYYYSIASLSKFCNLEISYLFQKSLQGDRKVADIYKQYFGIHTEFKDTKIILSKIPNFRFPELIKLNLNDCPDIVQTIAITASALKIPTVLTGLETLKIKETDRIIALHNELKKCGTETFPTENTLEIRTFREVTTVPKIQTYNDHRMAMAFTPLALFFPIEIIDEMVVKKSYPDFWNDMSTLGIK